MEYTEFMGVKPKIEEIPTINFSLSMNGETKDIIQPQQQNMFVYL